MRVDVFLNAVNFFCAKSDKSDPTRRHWARNIDGTTQLFPGDSHRNVVLSVQKTGSSDNRLTKLNHRISAQLNGNRS
jgi:hypothetical protein